MQRPSRQAPVDYLYQVGFSQYIDNHEIVAQYRARTREEIHTESLLKSAEFVPQLDEGDVLVEARRLPGVALSESVAQDARLQKAILTVPEVTQVVSKTGAPELATDPMGIEQTDVYITLKEREAWRVGLLKADLAQEISEAVEASVPEIAGGISQPIQMRTNELVAGIRDR